MRAPVVGPGRPRRRVLKVCSLRLSPDLVCSLPCHDAAGSLYTGAQETSSPLQGHLYWHGGCLPAIHDGKDHQRQQGQQDGGHHQPLLPVPITFLQPSPTVANQDLVCKGTISF